MKEYFVKLQKGNLVNPFTGKFDTKLLNSNLYDLEVNINGCLEYFRIRLIDEYYDVLKIDIDDNYKFKTNPYLSVNKEEVTEFRKSNYYDNYYENKDIIEKYSPSIIKKHVTDDDCVNFLRRIIDKRSFLASTFCQFYLPIKNSDIDGKYIINIENVRDRYYAIFLKDINYDNNYDLFVIYNKKNFLLEKDKFYDMVIDICSSENTPLMLTELVLFRTNRDINLTKEILRKIERYKNYLKHSNVAEYIKREMVRDNLNNSLIKILGYDILSLLDISLKYEDYLFKEIINYVSNDLDDIEFGEKTLKK